MSKMTEMESLMRKSGYSEKAMNYYIQKVNVGEISEPSVSFAYTGPCGDTMEIFLEIGSDNVIRDAKFQAIGCAGAFASGSALTEMIKGKTLVQAKKIDEDNIMNHLGHIPAQKIHCVCLARRTLEKAIERYKTKIKDSTEIK